MQNDMVSKVEQMKKMMPSGEEVPIPKLTEILHHVSEAGMPDYGIIYDIIKEKGYSDLQIPNPEDLFSEFVDIDEVKVEILEIKTDEEEKEQEIREQFKHQSELNLENLTISINGGIVSIPGLSAEVPVSLVGPYAVDDKIIVEGYIDLQMQATDADGNPVFDPSLMGIDPSEMTPETIEAMQQQMTPELLQAMQTQAMAAGITPEQIPGIAQMGGLGSPPFNQSIPPGMGTSMGLNDMATPEQLEKMGIVKIRQHEKMELTKTETGYEGLYTVRNFQPQNNDTSHVEEETAIIFNISLKCTHPKPPVNNFSSTEKIKVISSGIDDLDLD